MEYLGYKCCLRGFPGGSKDKVSACNAGDPGSILGLGRSPGEGNGNPLQYSCLEKSSLAAEWLEVGKRGSRETSKKQNQLMADKVQCTTRFCE